MTTERQACGFGSFLPMSCRGRAEAFARRLQSRLQTLGRTGSGGGTSSPADETSWLARQPEVTSHQPRLSTSSESDIFDFDLEYESPGSPDEESPYPGSLSDYLVNRNRGFQCPQYSSESGCVSSPSAITGTSPDSDSSDCLYFDPENLDAEVSSKHDYIHESSPEIGPKVPSQSNGSLSENSSYFKMNGHIPDLNKESSSQVEEDKRVGKRNFRNAAGFRVCSDDKSSRDESESIMNPISISDLGSLSSENSVSDEYFECVTPKPDEPLPNGSKCLHDSGFPNTAESSRCNSQNETRQDETNGCSTPQDENCSSVQTCTVPNGNSDSTAQGSIDVSSQTEDAPSISFHPIIFEPEMPESLESTVFSLEKGKSHPEFLNTGSTDSPEYPNDSCTSSSSESYTSTISRPSKLAIEYPIDILKTDASENKETTEILNKKCEEEEGDDYDTNRPIPRVRRCSSLKTGKTPPGTPGRKKIVRFADVLGLDLADVRTFLDEIPKIPRSAYEYLECTDILDAAPSSLAEGTLNDILVPTCISGANKPDRCLIPLFQQPAGHSDFIDRIRDDLVCLENVFVTDTVSYCISGTVRVRNLDFHKSVHVRYSLDGWKTFADHQATYVPNSCDGFSDKFSFQLYGHTVQVGQRLEFAIRFQCRGGQYWDSNRGANYAFQCLPNADQSSYLPFSPEGSSHPPSTERRQYTRKT